MSIDSRGTSFRQRRVAPRRNSELGRGETYGQRDRINKEGAKLEQPRASLFKRAVDFFLNPISKKDLDQFKAAGHAEYVTARSVAEYHKDLELGIKGGHTNGQSSANMLKDLDDIIGSYGKPKK